MQDVIYNSMCAEKMQACFWVGTNTPLKEGMVYVCPMMTGMMEGTVFTPRDQMQLVEII